MNSVSASFLSFFVALVAAMFLWHRLIHWSLAARGLADRAPPDPVEVRSKILPIYFRWGLIWFLASLSGIGLVVLLAGANWPLISAIAGVASVPLFTALSVRDALKLIENQRRGDHAA